MINICEDCPNNRARESKFRLCDGDDKVLISRSGSYELFTAKLSDDKPTFSHVEVNHPTFDESFPEAAESMDKCKSPTYEQVSISGIKGLFGLRKIRVASECPALTVYLDVNSTQEVEKFFEVE